MNANGPDSAGQLLAALRTVWQAVQRHHPEVPGGEVSLAALGPGARHLARGDWALGQLRVSDEACRRGDADEVLGGLLHEAGHALAAARGVRDTSREGRYHNRRYRTAAEEVGLAVEEDDPTKPGGGVGGWSRTTPTPDTAQRYAAEARELASALSFYRAAGEQKPAAPKPAAHNPIVATCACPRRIRVAPTVLAQAPILCGACQQPFTAD